MKKPIRLLLTLALMTGPAVGLPALTLDELAKQPELWPAQVTITAATKATVLKEGRPAGVRLLGAGKALVVAGISADGVTGRTTDATVLVPVDKTDLFHQVGQAHPEHATATQREAGAQVAAINAWVAAHGDGAPDVNVVRTLAEAYLDMTGGVAW